MQDYLPAEIIAKAKTKTATNVSSNVNPDILDPDRAAIDAANLVCKCDHMAAGTHRE